MNPLQKFGTTRFAREYGITETLKMLGYDSMGIKMGVSKTEAWSMIQKVSEQNNIPQWTDPKEYPADDSYHVTFEYKAGEMEPYTAAQLAWNILQTHCTDDNIKACGGSHVVINGSTLINAHGQTENAVLAAIVAAVRPNRKNRIGVQIHIWKEV